MTDQATAKDSPLESKTPEECKFQEGDNKNNILELTNTREENNDFIYSKHKRKDRRGGSGTTSKEHKDNKSISWRPKFNLVLVILVILMLGLFASLIVIAAYFSLELSELRTQLSDTKNHELNINKDLQISIAELMIGIENLNTSANEISPVAIRSSCKQALQLQGTPVPGYYWLHPSSGPHKPAYCSCTAPSSNIAGEWIRVAKLDKRNGAPLRFENLAVSKLPMPVGALQ